MIEITTEIILAIIGVIVWLGMSEWIYVTLIKHEKNMDEWFGYKMSSMFISTILLACIIAIISAFISDPIAVLMVVGGIVLIIIGKKVIKKEKSKKKEVKKLK